MIRCMRVNQFRKLGKQLRHLVLHDVPDDLLINCEVVMDDKVTEAGNLAPLYRGVLVSELLGYLFDGLSDDRQVAQHGVQGLLVRDEFLEGCPAVNRATFSQARRMSSRNGR